MRTTSHLGRRELLVGSLGVLGVTLPVTAGGKSRERERGTDCSVAGVIS